ncbi:MAG: phosphatase PAP2 family protein [Terriglobales bacterium]
MPDENTAPQHESPLVVRALVCALLVAIAVEGVLHLDFKQPFIGYGLGGAFLLFLAARPGWSRAALVSGIGMIGVVTTVWGHYQGIPTLLVQLMGPLGLASLVVMSCALLWRGRELEPASYRALLPGAALTFLTLGAQYSLNMASLIHAKTLDLYAYAFDGSLGFQPSFVLGRFLNTHAWLFPAVKVSYEGIVLAMAALYAGFMARREKPLWELIELLFAPAMVGYLFFSVFPVCGPHYAFAVDFPNAYLPYPMMHRLALESIPVLPAFPRNAVPSLHLTWALLIWLNTRGLPRWAQGLAGALVVATVFDTLATGEHYLFDLIVSLPFTLWMQACMVRTVKFNARERWLPALTGCGMFLAWLAIGRFGFHWMLLSRYLVWGLAAVSSAVSLVWTVKLPAMIPEMMVQPGPAGGIKTMTAAVG